ncbi:hypothetical protein C9F11_44245 (plasmid) [Streptomyces sp. YIM 121038]|uniref:class I SAM-dependent methyltransferase n=1 Tax=Streptomyces sp. YIM 121038 TaxID=2136401 RepID=UPI0011105FC0|nr:class I SAM-dependent methyltransferase [Streptomyces sp. YIM 121038]QCX82422.1 hypothetical protein C9F11_44245 [Streptomyces sp. YIM 121038]
MAATATPGESREQAYGAGLLDYQKPLELRRLRALEKFADPITRASISGRGLQTGWRCLELGGGAGSIAQWLARQCAPGEVVVTDIDTRLLSRRGVPNLTILRHDVVQDDFPAGSFSLVHARALLEHLPERDKTIARMVRWTAPGGWVCVDGLILVSSPEGAQNAYHRCMDALIALVSGQMQVDVRWATALPRLLAQAGLEDVDLMCAPGRVGRNGNADALTQLTLEQLGPAMVHQGLVTQQDLTDCRELLASGSYTDLAFLTLSTWGRRPHP